MTDAGRSSALTIRLMNKSSISLLSEPYFKLETTFYSSRKQQVFSKYQIFENETWSSLTGSTPSCLSGSAIKLYELDDFHHCKAWIVLRRSGSTSGTVETVNATCVGIVMDRLTVYVSCSVLWNTPTSMWVVVACCGYMSHLASDWKIFFSTGKIACLNFPQWQHVLSLNFVETTRFHDPKLNLTSVHVLCWTVLHYARFYPGRTNHCA